MVADADPMSTLEAKYGALEQLLDEIGVASSDACTEAMVADLAERHERVVRRMESIGNRRILEVSEREAFRVAGCRNLNEFVATRLRITHPRKRLRAVTQLEPMHAMTGEKLPPRCPNTAEGLAAGAIGPDHVDAIIDVMAKIPAAVAEIDRDTAESVLAEEARRLTPKEIIQVGVRILAHLDPDGTLTDDRDRARQRRLSLGTQDSQLMSKVAGTLDPTTRALFDVVLAAWAAPGMNNPGDEHSPRGGSAQIAPETLREAADRDTRSVSQRNHDALRALLQCAADGGLLGASHRGLPPHIVISITESELRERAGIAHSAGGTDLPITDVLALAARAQMHLAVFDDHTGEPLFLGRARRLASRAQRFLLFAKYGGCSGPECPTPFAHCEIHHADQDWAHGGTTDAGKLAPACGPHNRAVGPATHQWTTTKIGTGPDRGRYGWKRNSDPPDEIRVNHRHRISELLDRHRVGSGGDDGRAAVPRVDDPWADDAGDATDAPAESTSVSTVVEHRHALRLIEHVATPTVRVDLVWPVAA